VIDAVDTETGPASPVAETETSGPMGVGALLRTERLRRGTSLETLSRATRIPVRSLGELERGHWSALPPLVIIRGFIKSYCRALGVSPDAALERLDQVLAPPPVPLARPVTAGDRAVPLHARARYGFALLALVIVLVAVAARWLVP
jgi:cytoskeleton protein RodZ